MDSPYLLIKDTRSSVWQFSGSEILNQLELVIVDFTKYSDMTYTYDGIALQLFTIESLHVARAALVISIIQ